MAHRKRPDTHIGQRIGKITQKRLEQLEEALDQKHCLALFHLLMVMLHQIRKRLLEHEEQNRDSKEHSHHHISRNLMPGHIQHDRQHQKTIEDKSRNAICGKPQILRIMRLRRVDDLENHHQNIKGHTKGNGNDEHRIQLADEGQIRHSLNRPHPDRRNQILEPKDTAEHHAKDHGKNTRNRHNSRQAHLFLEINQPADQKQTETLSHITEHRAEDKRIRQGHEHGRVHLVMGRKPVHLDEQLKRLEKSRILELRRRFPEELLPVFLHDDEYPIIVLRFFHQSRHVAFTHPAAENIIIFLRISHVCARRHLPDVKIIGQLFKTFPCP